jgi:hypothetical protein
MYLRMEREGRWAMFGGREDYRADLDKGADSQSFNSPTTAGSIILGMVHEERM